MLSYDVTRGIFVNAPYNVQWIYIFRKYAAVNNFVQWETCDENLILKGLRTTFVHHMTFHFIFHSSYYSLQQIWDTLIKNEMTNCFLFNYYVSFTVKNNSCIFWRDSCEALCRQKTYANLLHDDTLICMK